MIEDLEKEFYAKIREVEEMRKKGIRTKEERDLVHTKERELLKLEEDMECLMTVEDIE